MGVERAGGDGHVGPWAASSTASAALTACWRRSPHAPSGEALATAGGTSGPWRRLRYLSRGTATSATVGQELAASGASASR